MNLVTVNPETGALVWDLSALLEPFVQVLLWACVAGVLVFTFWFGLRVIFRSLRALEFLAGVRRLFRL